MEEEEITIVEELWRRILESPSDVEDILEYWHFLLGIRGRVLSGIPGRELTYDEVAECISILQDQVKDEEAKEGQTVQKRIVRVVVNRRAGWWYAALAVLQVGLPKCGCLLYTSDAADE